MVRRGLVSSRSEAQAAISAGLVTVAGASAAKPSSRVSTDESIAILQPARRFVSRGGDKLEAALDSFGVDPSGVDCLDVGAATGGFTDCLLARGAARVVALDVGYGQLAWSLRQEPRVVVLERTNVRELVPGMLPFSPKIVAADLSFISLRLAVPALSRLVVDGATFLLLVKPQFEAGRESVSRGGVVRDEAAWRSAVESVASVCNDHVLGPRGAIVSPVRGPAGNVEFFLHAVRGAPARELDLESLVLEGRRLLGAA
jgi:23S rRNA (cytidine1920-2'-O)/16S rRNA (cytidine1409-2'-O)-methyltransferase